MDDSLQHISERLLNEGLSLNSPGLLNGKTGIAVFFFHYSRYTRNPKYEDYAVQFIDSVQDGLLIHSSSDYASGISGIGCGVEYLSQNGFIDTHTDEILEDIDRKIFRAIVYAKHTDPSLFSGVCGLGRYLLFRLANPNANLDKIITLTHRMLIIHVVDILEEILSGGTEDTVEAMLFLSQVEALKFYPVKVKKLLERYGHVTQPRDRINSEKSSLGIFNGYAGMGLSLLEKLDKQHQTWRVLL
jgi:hypothetical protein